MIVVQAELKVETRKKIIMKRKDKCIKNGHTFTVKPLNVFDLLLDGITPDWLMCTKNRQGGGRVIKVSLVYRQGYQEV